MKHIVVDLEMNEISRKYREKKAICKMEIIEIGAVLLDENYTEIGHFKTLVKPQFNEEIEPLFERITGITTKMVENAPVFEDGLKMFLSWCQSVNDDIQLYQWSDSDLIQITKEMCLKEVVLSEKEQHLLAVMRHQGGQYRCAHQHARAATYGQRQQKKELLFWFVPKMQK